MSKEKWNPNGSTHCYGNHACAFLRVLINGCVVEILFKLRPVVIHVLQINCDLCAIFM